MKKIIFFAAILFFACNVYAQSYRLGFKPANGDKYSTSTNMNMKMVQNMMGQEMEIKMKTDVDMSYDVAAAGENRSLKMTYDRLKTNMEVMGQNIVMDSNDPDTTSPQNKVYASLKGAVITAIVKPNGEVVEVQGVDELSKKLGNRSEMEKEMAKSFTSKDALKSMMEQAFKFYPDKAVNVGDTWTVTSNLESPYKMTSTNTYTLLKAEKNTAYLAVAGKLTTNGAQKIESNGMEMNVDLTGDQKGTMEIDIATGMPLASAVTQNLKGKMEVMGQEVPMNITIDSKSATTKK